MNWIKCKNEQFWFLWFSWALWQNWNENQIIIYRSLTIPVVLVKWNEKTCLLYIYILFYLRRTRHWHDSQRRRRYIKEVDQEVLYFAKECQRDVVQTLLDVEKHMDEIVSRHHDNDFFTQSWYRNDELQYNYVSYRESVVDDSWRSRVFEMSQIDPISTMDCSDCFMKRVLSIISSVMCIDTFLNWMNIQTDIKRWEDKRKYSNVVRKS